MTHLLALVVAQLGDAIELAKNIPGGPAAVVLVYGPLGYSCWWLSREHRTLTRAAAAREVAYRAELKARDDLLREISTQNVDALKQATHKIDNLGRGLIYQAAMHGSGPIQALAQREVEKWGRTEKD